MAQATDSRWTGAREHASLRWYVLSPSGLPYAIALLGGLVSTVLTYRYVGAGARELNPVMRGLIAATGFRAMVVLKMALLVAGYWGYAWLRTELPGRIVTTAAWLGALIHLADAVHDLRVALDAPFTPPVTAGDAALFVGVTVAGVVLWPRWEAPRRLSALLLRR